jgi:low affinity Fe/Cu permease
MLEKLLHNRTVQSVGAWWTFFSIIYSIILWLTPGWFGQFSYGRILLIGVLFSISTTFVTSISAFFVSYSFKIFRSVRGQSNLNDDNFASAQKLDDHTETVRHLVQTHADKFDDKIAQIEKALGKLIEKSRKSNAYIQFSVNKMRSEIFVKLGKEIDAFEKLLDSYDRELVDSVIPRHLMQRANAQHQGEQKQQIQKYFNILGYSQSDIDKIVIERKNEINSKNEFVMVAKNEKWESGEQKKIWYMRRAEIYELKKNRKRNKHQTND